jgi:peptidoglycan glycosyltransferase
MSSIGQFDVRSTALQMAMVVAAIANDGVLMQPHFVKDLRNQDLKILETIDPQIRQQTLSKTTAQALLSMMVGVVKSGTATSGRINGVTVGAKTGTAQSGTDAKSHAWFVANGQKGSRQISVAVVVENGGGAVEVSGNRIAGPIAAAVIKAYFN